MRTLLVLVVIAIAGLLLYIRFVPSDPILWNIDPVVEGRTGPGRYLVRPEEGDVAGRVHDATPSELLAEFDEIAIAEPRTRRLAGSVEEGRITYITRSRIFGFPDYTSVAAVEQPGGAAMAVYGRLRFGSSDMGVNRARIEDWLALLQARLEAR